MTQAVEQISPPVACAVDECTHSAHSLLDHIVGSHKITPEQYTTITGGAPLFSEQGREEYERRAAELAPSAAAMAAPRRMPARKAADSAIREKKDFNIRETFNIDLGWEDSDDRDARGNFIPLVDPKTGQKIPKERKVQGFADRSEWVPAIDPSYVFPVEETKTMLLGINSRDNILLVGETGTGKTSLLEQVAARINYNVVKINFDGHITRQDLVGEWVVKGREMIFQEGILVLAFRMPGTIIILDEWDTISGECSFVLQRPLQRDDRKILLMEKGGELVTMHPDNVIAATANTAGQGDDTGLYSQGTKVQNYAQLNRFSMTIRMQYLEEKKEIEMLGKRFPDLKVSECSALVKAVNAVRDGYKNGQISAPLSPRDLINWGEKYLRMGEPLRAAKYCFINRMPVEDAQVTEGIIQRVFENDIA